MSPLGPSVLSPPQQQASPSPNTQVQPTPASEYAHQKWNTHPQLYLARLPTVVPSSDNSSARSLQLGVPRPKRKRITPEQLEVLSNLFEYTDTPTFDLREAIGAKLGMSNREVQVWFQNRRAKVNRQRAPSNAQAPLQDRAHPSSAQQDPARASYGRLNNSSSADQLLLPSVSTIFHSSTDPSSAAFSSASLLPPFQPSLPGVSTLPDGLLRRAAHDRCQLATRPSSPQEPAVSERVPRPELQLRSPSGSHRRNIPSTPGSPYARKWLPRRAPDPAGHDPHPAPLSPRRSSTDPQPKPALLPEPSAAARPRWSSHAARVPLNASQRPSSSQYLNIGSMRLEQPHPDTAANLNSYSLSRALFSTDENPKPAPIEPQLSSAGYDYSPSQLSPTESNTSSRSSSPPSRHLPAPSRPPWQARGESMPSAPVAHPAAFGNPSEAGHAHPSPGPRPPTSSSCCAQARRSCSADEPTPPASRSLFSSRFLPPLPTPVRPGPGSFPPPAALRIVAIKRRSPPPLSVASSPTTALFRLPPLLAERPPEARPGPAN